MVDQYWIAFIIRDIFVAISLISSIINIIIILVQRIILSGRFTQLILYMQICFAIICICILTYSPDMNQISCQISAYFIQSGWIISFNFMLILTYTIFKFTRNQHYNLQRYFRKYIICAIIIPLVIYAIPIHSYTKQFVSSKSFSCSLDPTQYQFWIFEFLIQLIIAIFGIYFIYKIRAVNNQLTHEQKEALNILTLPTLNFILLLINIFIKASKIMEWNDVFFWFFGGLQILIYILPLLNLWLFGKILNKSAKKGSLRHKQLFKKIRLIDNSEQTQYYTIQIN